jgi:hypothetical protein
MRQNGEQPAIAGAFANPDDVAFGVDFDVRQAAFSEKLCEEASAFSLVERWRRHLGNTDQFVDKPGMVAYEVIGSALKTRACDDVVDF